MTASLSQSGLELKLQALEQLLKDLTGEVADEESLRKRLLQIVEKVAATIRLPGEYLWRLMVQPHEYAVMRVALELKLPDLLYQKGGCTTAQLAEESRASESLIIRLMRSLAAMGVFAETKPQTYKSTPISDLLAQDEQMSDTVKFMWDVIEKAVSYLPEYLAQSEHKMVAGTPGAWRLAFGKDTDFFSWIAQERQLMRQFHNMMAIQRFRRPDWYDVYPVQSNMIARFDLSIGDVLLVDIGGSRGHELQKFKARFPLAPGRTIVQDLPHVIATATRLETSGIEVMGHDFFTEQPVKGALVYYMRSILHDWDDEKCRAILRNIVPAMKAGYSRLIINDWVIPDSGALFYPCMQDINMMALFSGMERSQSQMTDLLDSVGLKIVHLWGSPDTERCIEAFLPE